MSSEPTLLYAPRVGGFKSPYPLMALVLGLLFFYVATSAIDWRLNIAAYFALVVGFLGWLYLATRNLWNMSISGGTPQFTPVWAVAWWFVPFANLWQPFVIVKELWDDSHPVGAGYKYVVPITAVWWLSFITGRILSWYYLGGILSTYTPTLEEVERNFVGYLVAGGLELLAALLLAIIVWQISRQQVKRRRLLTDVRP